MKIKILYFGVIAELKGFSEEIRTISSGFSTADLMNELVSELPQLSSINYAIAHNQNIITQSEAIENGSEISIFPPFAGG